MACAGAAHRAREQVQLEVGDAQRGLGRGAGARAPRQHLDPRQQLDEGEGLGEVIVAAGAQPLHAVVDLAQRRQQQHRHRAARGAQGAQHGQPVDLRQHAVEHQRVVGLGGGEEQAVLAVVRDVDHVPGLAQALGDETGHVGVVLDDQDAHGSCPSVRLDSGARAPWQWPMARITDR